MWFLRSIDCVAQGPTIRRHIKTPSQTAMEPTRDLFTFNAKEYKVVSLRECPTRVELIKMDQPQLVYDYWQASISTHPFFNPEVECLVAFLLNTRRAVKGHCFL